jgi:acetoin utilization protein AcuC
VNISGGLHHAMRDRASGFCVYDDPAVAIAWLLAQGATRVAYVDVDVHHGDGVEAAFYGDPRVLTVSCTRAAARCSPAPAGPTRPAPATRSAPTSTSAADGHRRRRLAARLRRRRAAGAAGLPPQVMLTQHGCDTHALDPLAHLMMSVDGQRVANRRLHELAHELCGGRWIAVGGGGYEPVQVVPAGLDPPAGRGDRRTGRRRDARGTGATSPSGTAARWRPTSLTDGAVPGLRARGRAARAVRTTRSTGAVRETREHAFPHLGLDPMRVDG